MPIPRVFRAGVMTASLAVAGSVAIHGGGQQAGSGQVGSGQAGSGQVGSGQTQVGPPQGQAPQTPIPGTLVPAATLGAISGVVLDSATGMAVGGAVAYLSVNGRGTVGQRSRQITDPKGRFAFADIPPGRQYTISAAKFGYLDGGFLRDDSGGGGSLGFVVVNDGEWVQNVKVALRRPGSISGVVTDEMNEPVVNVYVRALSRVSVAGHEDWAAGPLTLTDDHGAYRIGGLGPGRYAVQVPSVQAAQPIIQEVPNYRNAMVEGTLDGDATLRLVLSRYPLAPPRANGRAMAYAGTFHPGTPLAAQAGLITLDYAQARAGVDVRLEPSPAVRVSGVVRAPAGAPTAMTLRLVPAGLENIGQGAEVATTPVGADGRFTFLNVPSGAYTIDASLVVNQFVTSDTSPLRNGPRFPSSSYSSSSIESGPSGTSIMNSSRGAGEPYFARTPIVVSTQDQTNVDVVLRPTATMSGIFVVENDPSQPAAATPRMSVQMDPANGSPALGSPRSSAFRDDLGPNEFVVEGLRPGAYLAHMAVAAGWMVKSVQWKNKDYTDTPFDAATAGAFHDVVITVTNAVPTLRGVVRDRDGLPAPATAVIAFPTQPSLWTEYGLWPRHIKSAWTNNDGSFQFTTLAAGDYYVIATNGARTAWQDPEFFKAAAPLATRVTLAWGTQTGADLTVRANIGGGR